MKSKHPLLLATLSFTMAAMLTAFALVRQAIGEGWWKVIPISGLASALVAAFFWKRLVLAKPSPTTFRRLWVGGLVGLVSHPVTWYFLLLGFYLTGARDSFGHRTLNPLVAIPASLTYSFWSLALYGWAAIPFGMAVGLALGIFSRPCKDKSRPG